MTQDEKEELANFDETLRLVIQINNSDYLELISEFVGKRIKALKDEARLTLMQDS